MQKLSTDIFITFIASSLKLEWRGNEEQHLCHQEIISMNILFYCAHFFASACQKMKLHVGSSVVGMILIIACTDFTKN
jgi:hypothetical protein